MAKIGINGFGRIGRLVLRAAMEKAANKCAIPPAAQIVAINDPYLSTPHMAYLFTYDSNFGKYPGDVSIMGKCIIVDGQRIETFNEGKLEKIPWAKNCVDYVIDSSGVNDTYEKASVHLKAGAKRVIITTVSKNIPMFVVGVNHECYNNKMTVISCTTCSSNALCTLAKVIHDNFDIELGLLTTIHAVSSKQRVTDMGTKQFRQGRGALQNMIPITTDAIVALPKVIPELEGRISGLSVRVPIPTVSLLDLTLKLNKEASASDLKCKVKSAADTYMKGILGYTEDPLVSSDLIGDTRSCIFDAGALIPLTKCFVKVFAWYDNEFAYSNRVIEMANYIYSRENSNK